MANLAAANKFEPSHLETEKALAMLSSARFYYIAGFFLTVSMDAILKVAKSATEDRKVRSCNVVDVTLLTIGPLLVWLLWRLVSRRARQNSKVTAPEIVGCDNVSHAGRVDLNPYLIYPVKHKNSSIALICPILCTPFQVLAMNLSAPFLVQFFGEQMSAALAYSDYVFGNETEAAAFGEKQGWGSDLETTALKLAGKNTC